MPRKTVWPSDRSSAIHTCFNEAAARCRGKPAFEAALQAIREGLQ